MPTMCQIWQILWLSYNWIYIKTDIIYSTLRGMVEIIEKENNSPCLVFELIYKGWTKVPPVDQIWKFCG